MRPFGVFNRLFEEASGNPEGSGNPEAPVTSYKINGKDVQIADLEAAINLKNALADPDTGKELIEQLARRTGLLKDGEAPKPGTEAKLEGKIQKMLKTKFGKDYEKFADTLGPVLDEAIHEYMDELRESSDAASGANSWTNATDTFMESHQLTADIETQMQILIERNGGVPAKLMKQGGKAAQEYLNDMYELAVHKLGIEPPKAQRQRSTRSRSRDDDDEMPQFREVDRPRGVLTVDQIVDAAMKGQRFRS